MPKEHELSVYWCQSVGRIIRVRPAPQYQVVGQPGVKVYEIHPEDFKTLPHAPDGINFLMEYQVHTD